MREMTARNQCINVGAHAKKTPNRQMYVLCHRQNHTARCPAGLSGSHRNSTGRSFGAHVFQCRPLIFVDSRTQIRTACDLYSPFGHSAMCYTVNFISLVRRALFGLWQSVVHYRSRLSCIAICVFRYKSSGLGDTHEL